jgi:uncharacterized protein YjbI with pentapeptide repeats
LANPAPDRSSTAASRSPCDQRTIDAAVALHERFLRGALGGRRAFLRFADFTGANLEGSAFAGTHFERAALYCVNLEGCDLRATNLRRADLRGARLAGAVLSGAVMDEADMRAAYIAYPAADYGLHVLRHGKTPAKSLGWGGHGADFSNCAMRGVRLCAANLKGANFTGAVLESADFFGAKLTDAVFKDTVLTGVDLGRLNLSPAQLAGCLLGPNQAAIARADAIRERLRRAEEWCESGGRRGEPASIDDEDLRPMQGAFRGRVLTALSARRIRAIQIDFSDSSLQGAVFDGADLRGAVFDGCDLRGASFKGAKLSHARFVGADLKPLILAAGRPHPASFEGASTDRTDFSKTVFE